MKTTISVNHCATFQGKPMCVIDNLPGAFAEMRPEEIRAIAFALLRVADDCETLPIVHGKRRVKKVYDPIVLAA